MGSSSGPMELNKNKRKYVRYNQQVVEDDKRVNELLTLLS